MARERIENLQIETILTNEQIRSRLGELSKLAVSDFEKMKLESNNPNLKMLIVGILNGGVKTSDCVLENVYQLGIDAMIDYLGVDSYGKGTNTSGNPKITKDLKIDPEGLYLLVVEDIVDTGTTFKKILEILKARRPAFIKTLSLLSKPSRRLVEVPLDYLGFEVPDVWVEGFDIDSAEFGRGRPDIVIRWDLSSASTT